MEDILLGRSTSAKDSYPPIDATPREVVSSDQFRQSLWVQNVGANPVAISLSPGMTFAKGQLLAVGSTPRKFHVEKDGAMCTSIIYACCDAALTSTLAVWEARLPK